MWGSTTVEGLEVGGEASGWLCSFLGADEGAFRLLYHHPRLHNARNLTLYHKSTPKMLARPHDKKGIEQDRWSLVRLGRSGPVLSVVKQTDRCLLTTTDMEEGCHRQDGEPLKTLRRIRPGTPAQRQLNRHSPLFGLSALADQEGTVRAGDPVFVIYGHPENL